MQANSLLLTGVEAPAAAVAVGRFADAFSAASTAIVGALSKLQFLDSQVLALRGQANSSWHLLRGASPLLDGFYQCGWPLQPGRRLPMCVNHHFWRPTPPQAAARPTLHRVANIAAAVFGLSLLQALQPVVAPPSSPAD
jgi:hypothetical protein